MSQTETTKVVAAKGAHRGGQVFCPQGEGSYPTQAHIGREDSHRIGGVPPEGRRQRVVPAGGDQASFLLCMDEGVHGGWEGEAGPGRGARRHSAGGTAAQTGERGTQAVGGRSVPGGVPSQKRPSRRPATPPTPEAPMQSTHAPKAVPDLCHQKQSGRYEGEAHPII